MTEPAQPTTDEAPADESLAGEAPVEDAPEVRTSPTPEIRTPATRILLTPAAVEAIRDMIDDAELPSEGGVRLFSRTGAGCSAPLQYAMSLEDAPAEDDTILSSGDVRLFLDPESAWVLDGLQIDYLTDSPMGEGFAFRHRGRTSGRSC